MRAFIPKTLLPGSLPIVLRGLRVQPRDEWPSHCGAIYEARSVNASRVNAAAAKCRPIHYHAKWGSNLQMDHGMSLVTIHIYLMPVAVLQRQLLMMNSRFMENVI